MFTVQHSSYGHQAFVRHMAVLRTSITDPRGLALQLYSEGLIDMMARQKINTQSLTQLERSQELVEKLEVKIAANEGAFDTFLSILDPDPTMDDICKELRATREKLRYAVRVENTPDKSTRAWLTTPLLVAVVTLLLFVIISIAIFLSNTDCYELGLCYSKSLPHLDCFVGRQDDIYNITGYLNFNGSDIRVVHIVGPPGFGKSTLAIKVGEMFVRRKVTVHYVDLSSVTDVDSLSEKLMLNIFDSISNKVKFSRFQKWVQKQYTNTLLIFDNCDKLLDNLGKDFIQNIKSVSTKRNVKYLLTSQYQLTDVGYFRLHTIYNLSTEASIELLSRVAPQLTNDQMIQIANVAGNVPLALDIIGAIFNFPEAPSVMEIIQGLREDIVATLSSPVLVSSINVSIDLAYGYLTPHLKQLCVDLSHFPDTFTDESSYLIIGYVFEYSYFKTMLKMLVQRSLLQFNYATKRFHFHQLLRTFFYQKNTEVMLTQYFNGYFQIYYAQKLVTGTVIDLNKLFDLYMETHNFNHMFSLFKTSKTVNLTFDGVKYVLYAMKSNLLSSKLFSPMERLNYCLQMLEALDSYTDDEIASIPSFLDVYTSLVIVVAKQKMSFPEEQHNAIAILKSKRKRIDEAYRVGLVQQNTYRNFYSTLGNYYMTNGNEVEVRKCHTRILQTYGEFPNCDYFSISTAYSNIRERSQAFHFRELAYEQQLTSLNHMDRAQLLLLLYFDYSSHVGDNIDKANNISTMIENDVFQYLETASISDFSEYTYEVAIEFFQRKKDKEKVNILEHKMLDADLLGKCDKIRCVYHYLYTAEDAFKKHCYYRVIGIANASFQIDHDHPQLKAISSAMIGLALYYLGNISDSQRWLKESLHHANIHLRNDYNDIKIRDTRRTICWHLLMSGDVFNVFCNGYLIKDFVSVLTFLTIEYLHTGFYSTKETEVSILSSITEQKHSYIWSLVDKHIATRLDVFWFTATNILHETAKEHSFSIKIAYTIFLCVGLHLIIYGCSFIVIRETAEIMISYCTEKQIQLYFSCCNFCIITSIVVTFSTLMFLLCLD